MGLKLEEGKESMVSFRSQTVDCQQIVFSIGPSRAHIRKYTSIFEHLLDASEFMLLKIWMRVDVYKHIASTEHSSNLSNKISMCRLKGSPGFLCEVIKGTNKVYTAESIYKGSLGFSIKEFRIYVIKYTVSGAVDSTCLSLNVFVI